MELDTEFILCSESGSVKLFSLSRAGFLKIAPDPQPWRKSYTAQLSAPITFPAGPAMVLILDSSSEHVAYA